VGLINEKKGFLLIIPENIILYGIHFPGPILLSAAAAIFHFFIVHRADAKERERG